MKIFRGIDSVEKLKDGTAVTIGVYDGVHKGHQAVISKLIKQANEKGLKTIAVTFDPHPLDILRPKKYPTILTALPLKLKLLEELGLDMVLIINFTQKIAEMKAEDFVKNVLVDKLNIRLLVVGERFCLGSNRDGDINTLLKLSTKYGFTLRVIGKILDEKENRISSTHIRNLIYEGDLDTAAKILGRYPTIIGTVEHGDGRGGLTGFHTANVVTQDKASIPRSGVYAGRVSANSISHPAVINIGASPTFGVKKKRIEAHVIDFNKELYGKDITITLVKKIRDIECFNDHIELSHQIEKDIQKAKDILRKIDNRKLEASSHINYE